MLNAYSRQVGLALVREIAPTLSLRLYRRERAGILGSMTGIVVGAIVLTVLDDSDSSWSGMLLVVAMTIGSTIAVIVTDSRSAFAPVAESPRLARSVSPRLDDYVTPLDRAFSLGFIGLATLGYIAVLGIIAINPQRMFDDVSVRTILWPAGSLLALATAASLTTWTSAGALLGRGQPASTFVELAWSDAFRSTTLRGLVSVPGVIAAVSAGVLFLSLSGALSSATPSAFGGVLAGSFTVMGPVLLIALLAWYLTSLRNRSTTHYLRRLWPETAVELDRRRGARSSGVTGPPDGGSRAKTPA
jgi:MFS family permease